MRSGTGEAQWRWTREEERRERFDEGREEEGRVNEGEGEAKGEEGEQGWLMQTTTASCS